MTTPTLHIAGIAGSLRTGSYNGQLLAELARLAPAGVEIEVLSLRGVPLYDGDEEAAHGVPEAVTRLKDRVAAADGLLLVTPEYNSGMPGVFKNAIDGLSRPASDLARVFGNKPTALTGITPGQGGTIASQTAWAPVQRALGMLVWPGPRLYLSGAGKAFDGDGKLADEATRKRVGDFIAGFAGFVARVRGEG